MGKYSDMLAGKPATPAAPPAEAPVLDLPEFNALIPQPAEMAGGLPDLTAARNAASAMIPFVDFSVPEKPKQVKGRGGSDLPILGSGKPVPEKLTLDRKQADQLIRRIALAQDENQLADSILSVLPDAKITQDAGGRLLIEVQGKRAYLNRPGASGQDAARAVTQGTAAALAARATGGLPGVAALPILARAPLMGGTVAATGAAQDVAMGTMGAKGGIDPGRAVTNFALGTGAEFLAPVIQGAYNIVIRNRGLFDQARGRLTEAGRRLLQQAGASADDISDDLARSFAQQARRAANPEDALRMAEAASLPVPIPPTRGQITNLPSDLRWEQQARQGTFGEGAQTTMRGAEAAQQEALRANIPAIQGRMAGRGPVIEPGQGGAVASDALNAQREALEESVRSGYRAARNAPGAGVSADLVDDLGNQFSQRLATNYTPGTIPKADAVLADFGRLTNAARTTGVGNTQSQGPANTMVKALFDWRARANATWKGADDGEKPAIRDMIGQFDDWIERTVDDALLAGDEQAVRLWQQAIASRRELGSTFQGKDLVQTLTETAPRGGQTALRVAPEDAANKIFTASNTGWISKPNILRDLRRMRQLLGADSHAWNALRQEAFLRFARMGEGATEGGQRLFSGVNFQKGWQDALSRNSQLMQVLFNDTERNTISQFARVAARVTNRVPYNTAADLATVVRSVGGGLFNRFMTLVSGFPVAGELVARPAMNAVRTLQAGSRAAGAAPAARATPGLIGPWAPPAYGRDRE